MKRLRDASDTEPLLARGIEIVQATPPAPPMPDVRRRVWAALQSADTRAQVRPAMRRASFLVLALMAGLLLVGGTAGAVIGQRWIAARLSRAAEPARADFPARESSGTPPRLRPHRIAASMTPQAFAPVSADERRTPPASGERRLVRVPASRIVSSPVASSPAPSPTGAGFSDGPVLEAMVALRRDHDPAHAADLLARYLATHPRGALREEALVLSVEAADAQGDNRAVDRLVSQYRASYRTGRFKTYIDRHVENHPNDAPK